MKQKKRIPTPLKKAREAQGLTQLDLANLAGISKEWLAQIERGLKGSSTEVKQRIANALGIDVETIFPEIKGMRQTALLEILEMNNAVYEKIRRSKTIPGDEIIKLKVAMGKSYRVYCEKLYEVANKYGISAAVGTPEDTSSIE